MCTYIHFIPAHKSMCVMYMQYPRGTSARVLVTASTPRSQSIARNRRNGVDEQSDPRPFVEHAPRPRPSLERSIGAAHRVIAATVRARARHAYYLYLHALKTKKNDGVIRESETDCVLVNRY